MSRSSPPMKGVRSLREEHGLTQQEFADRVGVSRRSVIDWENDKSGSQLSVRLIAEAFGVPATRVTHGSVAEIVELFANFPLSETPPSPPPPSVPSLTPEQLRGLRDFGRGVANVLLAAMAVRIGIEEAAQNALKPGAPLHKLIGPPK